MDITQDRSEKSHLEQELEHKQRILRFQADILETTHDAVIAIDSSHRITYYNAGAERMYKVFREDALGKEMSTVYEYRWVHPEDEERAWSEIAERGRWRGENIHIRKDGTFIHVDSTVNTLPEEWGGGLVAIIRDISALRKAEMESRKNAKELLRANADLLHFAYAVSHDLQAPLRTITTFSQRLEKSYRTQFDQEGSELLRLMGTAGSRMMETLRHLLQFATASGGELEWNADVRLERALASALANLRSAIEETGAAVSHDSLPTVVGDEIQLAQVFQNLIGNAIQYRKADLAPLVHVTAKRGEREWTIQVSDNGIGFEPDQAERIFGVFERLHAGGPPGTGIGLTICKRIVERRGGRIWAASKPREGSVFSFTIPDYACQGS